MADGKFIGLGGVGLLAVLSCAGAALLVAIGSLGVSAWFAAAGYVLIPIALAPLGWLHFIFTGAAIPARQRMLRIAARKQG